MLGREGAYITPCLNTETEQKYREGCMHPSSLHTEAFTLGLLFIHWLPSRQNTA